MKIVSAWSIGLVVLVLADSASAAFPPNCNDALVLPVESIPEQSPGEEQWDRASFLAARAECQRLAGVAPQCRGQQGAALIRCVDTALDAEDE